MEAKPQMNPGNSDWFAVQVRARWEESTARLLSQKGYETLLPMYKSERRWGGRLRTVEAPLFPSYVFCRFDVLKRLPILVTPGIMAIVSRGRVPVPIEPSEIANIQTLVLSGAQAEPWPYLEVGKRVRIEDTALHGVEGILIGFKGNRRIVVSVSLLRRSVALEIDRALVVPVSETRNTTATPTAQALRDPVFA
jgi:transcription antitermination factor NusG